MGRIRDAVASAAITGVGFTLVAASFKSPLEPIIGLGMILGLAGLFSLMGVLDRKYI